MQAYTSPKAANWRAHEKCLTKPQPRITVATRSKREERKPNMDSSALGVLPTVPITSLHSTKSLKDLTTLTPVQDDQPQAEAQQAVTGKGTADSSALTVYSVRFTTGNGRGAALSECAHVNVCLFAKDGRAAMHRISPVFDPQQDSLNMEKACQVSEVGNLGADCVRSMRGNSSSGPADSSAAADEASSDKPRIRFQEGTVDEVCFVGPELGKLAGILVGTENGSWALEEVHVASSRTGIVQRFVCRSLLGSQRGEGACFLTPVAAGSVVYGTGSSAVTLTKEEAAVKRAASMASYEALKQRLLTTNALLVLCGSGVSGVLASDAGAALSFGTGGAAGVVYQWLLQQGVDSMAGAGGEPLNLALAVKEQQGASRLPLSSAPVGLKQKGSPAGQSQPGHNQLVASGGAGLRRTLGRPLVRLLLLLALGTGGAYMLQAQGPSGLEDAPMGAPLGASSLDKAQLVQLALGILGFLTYKVALISVSLAPQQQQQQQ